MTSKTKLGRVAFIYKPADDEGVDSEYEMLHGGEPTGISIQDCRSYGAGWTVCKVAANTLTMLGEAKSLKAAKVIATAALEKQFAPVTVTVKNFEPRPARPEYTDDQLRAAFKKVADKKHWKNPINALIDETDRDIIDAAIPFITGSVAEFSRTGIKGKLRVRAAGYFNAVGA